MLKTQTVALKRLKTKETKNKTNTRRNKQTKQNKKKTKKQKQQKKTLCRAGSSILEPPVKTTVDILSKLGFDVHYKPVSYWYLTKVLAINVRICFNVRCARIDLFTKVTLYSVEVNGRERSEMSDSQILCTGILCFILTA